MNSAAIIGIGMITPLGLSAEQTAASIHAGLSAFDESSIMDAAFDPIVLASLPDDVLGNMNPELAKEEFLTQRESRLLRLAAQAIESALAPLSDPGVMPSLYIGLPTMNGQIAFDPDRFLRRLHIQSGEAFDVSRSSVTARGRASGLNAVHDAVVAIAQGKEEIVLAGGADTFIDLYTLATMDHEKRISSDRSMDGFIPGEGAAFLLLAAEDHIGSGAQVLGRILSTSTGEEPGHMYSDEPYKGEGLSGTLAKLFEQLGDLGTPIPTVFSSMNGESHFGKEWGVSYIRFSDKIENDYRIEHPADCIGDTGAACGPIMIGLALAGFNNDYLNNPALVYASSDRESRAACVVDKIE